MTQRLILMGFSVQPRYVLVDDDGEVGVDVPPERPVVCKTADDLVAWAADRWPLDFAVLKSQLAEPDRAPDDDAADGGDHHPALNGGAPSSPFPRSHLGPGMSPTLHQPVESSR